MIEMNNRAQAGLLSRPMSRRTLLRSSLMAGAGALAMTAFGPTAGRFASLSIPSASAQVDTVLEILNYALTLEYLEAEAYDTVLNAGILSGRAQTYFESFGDHEQQHVDTLRQTIQDLGGTPIDKPAFDFSTVPMDPAAVVEFFQMVEAVGASAYLGVAPMLIGSPVLTPALTIHAVEAEHASALADLVAPGTDLFAPDAFGESRTPDQVMEIIAPLLAGGAGGGMPGMPATGGGGMSRKAASGHRGALR